MNLPKLTDFDIEGKRVIIRMDLDVDVKSLTEQDKSSISESDIFRLEKGLQSLRLVVSKASKTIIIGHRGRPEFGKEKSEEEVINEFTLKPLVRYFNEKLGKQVDFVPYHYLSRLYDGSIDSEVVKIVLVENFRFWPEEEENKLEFCQSFTQVADFFVNEAFSVSHRKHASIVGIPQYVESAVGIRFSEEVAELSKVFEKPKRPVVCLISGLKEDKLDYVDKFKKFSDRILIGGRLPEYLGNNSQRAKAHQDDNIVIANLIPDKEDITPNSIEVFEEEIGKAGTIVVSGPMGKFEDEGHRRGTERIFNAVANANAFKIAGGGDTQEAFKLLGLSEKLDWISVGGGAMLEFLANGTLPGIEALISKN